MKKNTKKTAKISIQIDESVLISRKIKTAVVGVKQPSAGQADKVGKLAGKRAALLAERALREAS